MRLTAAQFKTMTVKDMIDTVATGGPRPTRGQIESLQADILLSNAPTEFRSAQQAQLERLVAACK